MATTLNIGVIGLGNRGMSLLENCILPQPDVQVLAVCDSLENRCQKGVDAVIKVGQKAPLSTTQYQDILKIPEIDAVIILASWE